MRTRRTAYQRLTPAERRAADQRDLRILRALVKRLEPEPRHPKAADLLRKNVDWTWDKVRSSTQWGKHVKTGAWGSQLARCGGGPVGLHGEHIVPFAVIRERLFELSRTGRLTTRELRRLLDIPMAVITTAENTMLTDAGLARTMPPDFSWDEITAWEESIWSRHVAAGLNVSGYRQHRADDGPGPI